MNSYTSLLTSIHTLCLIYSRGVASLTVPGGQDLHFPQFSTYFHTFSPFFWPSGRACHPHGKVLATPLIYKYVYNFLDFKIFWETFSYHVNSSSSSNKNTLPYIKIPLNKYFNNGLKSAFNINRYEAFP